MQDDHDQVKLKLIPKPEGFDLRDKRSDKSGRGADWTPNDALYSTQQLIKDKEIVGLSVCWFEKKPDGTITPVYRYAGESNLKLRLLVSAMGSEMGWS